jgi:hypothetical protein
MSASIIQLYRLVDIEDPVSVPPPPVPFRSPQKGCCARSRLFRHGLGLTATSSANASRAGQEDQGEGRGMTHLAAAAIMPAVAVVLVVSVGAPGRFGRRP